MPSQRRVFLCRLGFILLCVAPTLVVATGVLLPSRRQPWEDRVFRQLGFVASIGQVRHPRPNATVLDQVVISDPDSGIISRVHAVEVQESPDTLKLRLIHLEVRGDRLDHLYSAIQQHVMRRQLLERSVEVTCGQLILLTADAQSDDLRPVATLVNANCRIASTAKGCKLDLRFSPPGTRDAAPCQISVERESGGNDGPTVLWKMNTHQSFVSCEAFAALIPPLARLGADCHFRGSIQGKSFGKSWNGAVVGEFINVDMYRLIQDQFQHTFDGRANVNLTTLEIQNDKIVRAVGRVRSEGGTIGNSLVEAAAEQLGCRLTGELVGVATRYRAIDVSFDISAEGMVIIGNCKSLPSTVIEGQYGEPLLAQPKSPQPLAALARMLVPQSDVQVPLTRETSKLISLFPIPSLERHQKPGTPRAVLRLQ